MPEDTPGKPRHPVRTFFRGLGNITEFLREATLALVEVAIGRWPQPFGELRQRPKGPKGPKAPNQGLGPLEKIAPFPLDD